MKPSLLILSLLTMCAASCQPITITGKVINEDNEPIAGATITIKQFSYSTTTDAKGQFTIDHSPFTDTLLISAIGYEPLTYIIDHLPQTIGRPVTIVLHRKIKTLGEVVINTGYQQLYAERSTGAFEKLDNNIVNRRVSTDIISRLEGVSSVYFDNRNIGGGAITIRGRSTLFANAYPLIIVDNFPYEGSLSNINPNDVEDITVLKDAAATSIWGVRAGNGVIVITTKKGKYKKPPSLQFNTNITVGTKPDLFYTQDISAADFIDLETYLFSKGFYNGDIANNTTRPPLTPVVELLAQRRAGLINAADSARLIDPLRSIDVRNDLDKYFYRHAVAQQYAINYSGGAENINYVFSFGYDKNLSSEVRNGSERLTFSSRSSYTPLKFLELSIGLVYTSQQIESGNNPGQNIRVGNGKGLYPYALLAGKDGEPLPVVKDYRYSFIDTAGAGKLLDWKYRPLQELSIADNKAEQSHIRYNFTASFRVSSYFKIDLLYQYEQQKSERKNLSQQNSYSARNLFNRYYNPSLNRSAVPLGSVLDQYYTVYSSHNGRVQANYHRSWSFIHDVAVIGGAELRQSRSSSANYRTYGYNDDVLTYTNVNFIDIMPIYAALTSPQLVPNPQNFSAGISRFVSLYANAAYTFKNRYVFSASGRKDASNLFGVESNQKWVPLWSAGFSWMLNKEKFYKLDFLPYLKIRFTYGYSGNVDNSLSAFTTLRYTTGAMFTSQQYATIQNPPNPELRWEKLRIANIGFDFALKNDRISGSIDYYRKYGKDLIGLSPVDPTTGVTSSLLTFTFKGNVASMKADGIDLVLNTKNIDGKFSWASSFILSHSSARVTKYIPADLSAYVYLEYGTTINPIPGKPLYTIYSYPWAGLDPATGDPMGYINGAPSKDYSALTTTTVDKLVYHGSAIPVFFGSLRNSFSWKNFSVSANLVYKLNYYFRRTSLSYSSLFNNWSGHADYAKRWQKPGDENYTYIPSFIYPNSDPNRDNFFITSSPLVEKGDHIRLQDISFSYTVQKTNKRSWFKTIQLYSYLNNLGIVWKANKAGLDPDYFAGGYPLPKTYAIGIKTTF
jgi:TonB-dependent starch-binding outer membrane protein SusC